MLHLALQNQVLNGTRNIFDWHIQIDTMLVKEIATRLICGLMCALLKSRLFTGLGRQRSHYPDILKQLLRYVVSAAQVFSAVVGDPNLRVTVFPDQNLEREVDSAAGGGQHDRSACLWTSE